MLCFECFRDIRAAQHMLAWITPLTFSNTGGELLAQARADLEVTISEIERSTEGGMSLVQELELLSE